MVRTVEVMGGKTRLVSIMFNLKTEDNSVFVFNYDQAMSHHRQRLKRLCRGEGDGPAEGARMHLGGHSAKEKCDSD